MSGRERNKKEPFWATSLGRMNSGVAGIVRELAKVVDRSPKLAPYVWMGSGWRTGSSEHASGRAIDIMITADTGRMPSAAERAAGNLLVEWLIHHADQLGVYGIIFSRDSKRRPELWGYSKGRYWRAQQGRGSISGDHVDHVHVLFKSGARWSSELNSAVIGGDAAKPAPKPNPEPKPSTGERTLKRGVRGDDVLTLQRELLRVFPAYAGRIRDNGGPTTNFGPATEAVVREFQRRHGKGLAVDGIVGPKTRAALASYGVKV